MKASIEQSDTVITSWYLVVLDCVYRNFTLQAELEKYVEETLE